MACAYFHLEAIASRLEAIASRLEAITIRNKGKGRKVQCIWTPQVVIMSMHLVSSGLTGLIIPVRSRETRIVAS